MQFRYRDRNEETKGSTIKLEASSFQVLLLLQGDTRVRQGFGSEAKVRHEQEMDLKIVATTAGTAANTQTEASAVSAAS